MCAEMRAAINALMDRLPVRFTGRSLDGDSREVKRRVEARGPDASDAAAAVIDQQWRSTWGRVAIVRRWHKLDASPAPANVAVQAMKLLAELTPERGHSEPEHPT